MTNITFYPDGNVFAPSWNLYNYRPV